MQSWSGKDLSKEDAKPENKKKKFDKSDYIQNEKIFGMEIQ